jgi:hypothetical protein
MAVMLFFIALRATLELFIVRFWRIAMWFNRTQICEYICYARTYNIMYIFFTIEQV